MALALAGGDTDVGLSRFTGSIDDAAHDGHLDRKLLRLEGELRRLGDRHHVDIGATARWAGNEIKPGPLAQTQLFEQTAARLGLLDGIGGEREADGVTDALEQERGNASDRLHQAGGWWTRLGDAEVKGVLGLRRKQTVRLDHRSHVAVLHRDLDVVKPDVLEQMDLGERRLDQRLGNS